MRGGRWVSGWPVALALGALAAGCRPSSPAAIIVPPPAVTVAVPEARRVTEWDEFTGRLASPESVEVRARVSGYLDAIHFTEGAEVKQGDLLFTIDPRPYETQVARLTAEVDKSRARAELVALEARNAERLRASQALSSEETERRMKAVAEATASIVAAESARRAAELDLEFTQIRSPIAGRISDARVRAGNLVNGGAPAATLLTTVVSLDPIYCYLDVDERSALKYRQLLREGKRTSGLNTRIPAEMALADQTGFPHRGEIDFVDNQLDPTTGIIRARAVFPNADRLMAPGFFARVRIPGSDDYDALLVRDEAIGDDQGRSFVWVVGAGEIATQRPVVPGPMMDGLRVVREGLTAGDRVVISGQMNIRPGKPVAAAVAPMVPVAPAPR